MVDEVVATEAEKMVLAGCDVRHWSGLTLYLAGPYGRREELLEYRLDLLDRGHRVPARWLHGDHQVHGAEANQLIESGGSPPVEISRNFAEDDLEDIQDSDVIVNFTEPVGGAPRGGRHVEFGFALAQRRIADRFTLVVVGPVENIFHAVPEVLQFPTWQSFMHVFDEMPEHCGNAYRLLDGSVTGPCPLHPWHQRGPWPHNRCCSPQEMIDP